jgi:hypothetical protein
VGLQSQLLPLAEYSGLIAFERFLFCLTCLPAIGCSSWLGCWQLRLRCAGCWLVSPWLFLAAVARLCLAVPILLSLVGFLPPGCSLLLVKRARLPLLVKRACLVPSGFGWLVAGGPWLLGGGRALWPLIKRCCWRCNWWECGTLYTELKVN